MIKFLTPLLLLVLFAARTPTDITYKYIENFGGLAIEEMQRTGIPASIKLAQAIVESGCGKSILAARANNHFGIKCKSYWTGQKYYYYDDDKDSRGNAIESCFRYYDTAEASYLDHSVFLVSTERYQSLFTYDPLDYKSWARGLKRCGYATDTNYSVALINTIEKYSLYEFDLVGISPATDKE
jgi:flagellum-specific peptidoglycan hydrolase FlgJ